MMRVLANWVRAHPRLRQRVRNFRMFFLRRWYRLSRVHPTFYMRGRSRISRDFVVGAHSIMGFGCWIPPNVRAGNYVMFAPGVAVVGADHRYDISGTPMLFSGRVPLPETIIEDDVWLGYGVTLMAGVRVGRGSIVAAGSIVTRDVPPYSVVAGVPAKVIKQRFEGPAAIAAHDAMLSQPPPAIGTYPEARGY